MKRERENERKKEEQREEHTLYPRETRVAGARACKG